MAEAVDASEFRFLYRQAEGVIDRATWVRASLPPIAIGLALTVVAWFITPDHPRDLATQAFIDGAIVARNIYFLVYAFALILCAVAEYFVSAKRFADRGLPGALAGLAPFALLLAGAANWYQPRSEGSMPAAATWAFDAAAAGIVAWSVVELGFRASRRA
jgi:uncharacterized membrane protein YhaH (DUF805 family)